MQEVYRSVGEVLALYRKCIGLWVRCLLYAGSVYGLDGVLALCRKCIRLGHQINRYIYVFGSITHTLLHRRLDSPKSMPAFSHSPNKISHFF